MASIADTRTAIMEAVEAIPLRCFDYAPQNLPFPCAVVGFPSRYDPSDTFSDTATLTIPVTLYVRYSSNRAAEDELESYLDTSGDLSIIAAVEAIGSNYVVAAVRDFGLLTGTNDQPIALGCVVDVNVFA